MVSAFYLEDPDIEIKHKTRVEHIQENRRVSNEYRKILHENLMKSLEKQKK